MAKPKLSPCLWIEKDAKKAAKKAEKEAKKAEGTK